MHAAERPGSQHCLPLAARPDYVWLATDVTDVVRLAGVAEVKQRYARPRVAGSGLVDVYNRSGGTDKDAEAQRACKQVQQLCGALKANNTRCAWPCSG